MNNHKSWTLTFSTGIITALNRKIQIKEVQLLTRETEKREIDIVPLSSSLLPAIPNRRTSSIGGGGELLTWLDPSRTPTEIAEVSRNPAKRHGPAPCSSVRHSRDRRGSIAYRLGSRFDICQEQLRTRFEIESKSVKCVFPGSVNDAFRVKYMWYTNVTSQSGCLQ